MDSLGAYDIADDLHVPLSLRKGRKLLARGFPTCETIFDYQKRHIEFKALEITGSYREKSALGRHCHLFDYDGLTDIVQSANGMSGSPVFQVEKQSGKNVARLAGILIKGDDSRNLGCFIDVSVLTSALRQILQGNTSPKGA